MARLIDENDVYSLFGPNGTASLHVADIDRIQRVDAVPVVHGRWIYVDGKGSNAEYECSQCRIHVCFDEQIDGTIPPYNYCPNCGAKMDGGAEDGK